MLSSSAYECYANVIVPKRSTPSNMTSELINQYHTTPSELMHDTQQNEYPQPEYEYYVKGRQSASLPCYECVEMQSEMQNMPVYDIYSQRRHLERFGLSKRGLLQIDYSLSWMNLQRFITSK